MTQTQTITKNIQKKVRKNLIAQEAICGDCDGFECEVLRGTKLCRDQDVLETSEPCTSFVPSIRKIRTEPGDSERDIRNIIDLAGLFQEIPDSKLRAVGVLLMDEVHTRKNGYNMGQKVFVRYRGRANINYLSNFMTAHIMSVKKDTIRLMSADGKICMTLRQAATKTVYTPEEFGPMRNQMIKKGRFADPEVHRTLQKSLRCEEEYELGLYDKTNKESIPTIDSVFKTNKIRKSSRTADADLVAIVGAIENHFDAKTVEVERKKKKRRSKKTRDISTFSVS